MNLGIKVIGSWVLAVSRWVNGVAKILDQFNAPSGMIVVLTDGMDHAFVCLRG
jgi:hypothetical protein